MAARADVGEGKLSCRVGRRDHPVFGPDVDVGKSGLTRSLHAVAVRIHPDLADRGSRFHGPRAADLHPRDRLWRTGQPTGHLAARDGASLSDSAGGGNQDGHEAQRVTRAGREDCGAIKDQPAARDDGRIGANRATLNVARANRKLHRDLKTCDIERARIPRAHRVWNRLADRDLEHIRGQIQPQCCRGRSDEGHLRRRGRGRGRSLALDVRHVPDQHCVAHGRRDDKHQVDHAAVARHERPERPGQDLT